jgi:hypothetical protein
MGNGKSTAYCCWRAQKKEEIEVQLDDYDVHYLLKAGQCEIYALLFVHLPILMLWMFATLNRGFAIPYDGTGFNVISHLWIFTAWELLILTWGFFAVGFSYWVTKDGRLQKDSASIRWRLKWWFAFLVLGIIAHIIHLVGSFWELETCNSTLCNDYQGLLIALIVALFVLIALEVIEIYRGAVFHWHLFQIASLKPHIFNEQYTPAPGSKQLPSNNDKDYVVNVAPSAPMENPKAPGQVLYKIPTQKRIGHGLRKNRSE